MFGWFRASKNKPGDPLAAWRAACAAALNGDEDANADELRRQLEAASSGVPDTEIELEMLDALERLHALRRDAASGTLPRVDTHHRVVGGDACHFTAPASLPDDPAQASGRVLLTGSRAIFVGGGRTSAVAWHQVHHVVRQERDVILARADRTPAANYRFNTYSDAVSCAFLARQLGAPAGRRL